MLLNKYFWPFSVIIFLNNTCQFPLSQNADLIEYSNDLVIDNNQYIFKIKLDSAWREVPAITWGERSAKKFTQNNNEIQLIVPTEIDDRNEEDILSSYIDYIYYMSNKSCLHVKKETIIQNSISALFLYCLSDSINVYFLIGIDKGGNIPIRVSYVGNQMTVRQFKEVADRITFEKR